jgi:hypothetical protein
MAIAVKVTNDCKNIIVSISQATETEGSVKITNGSNSYILAVAPVNGSLSITVATTTVGAQNGVFYVEYIQNGETFFQSAGIGNCDVMCCLAKKVDKLLDCSADCAKCASELAEAQQIFLLMKSAETELSSMTGSVSSAVAIIDNAAKKYNKAVEICGGHCGCNC